MNLSPDKKIAGVLAPLFALRREDDLGIGDLAALREFIDWSEQGGFRLVQLLPINETGGDNSPYNAISAMAIEPTTLELAPGTPVDLTQEIFAKTIEGTDLTKLRRGNIKYPRVKKLKLELLEAAFENFGNSGSDERKREFHEFVEAESEWLRDYTLFRALIELNNGSEMWDQWPEEYQTVERAREWLGKLPADRQEAIGERRIFFCYVQWIANQQWREIKAYAEQRGVALMGDIPFGVSYYSADVFTRPNEFALDWAGGAPPEPYFKDDEFTQKWGQNWGIPLYRWDVMAANHFRWWRQRVRGVKHVFHVFRIDHVLGFYRIYSFPWRPTRNQEFLPLSWDEMKALTGGREPHFAPRDDLSPENAEANRREGEEYLRVVLREAGATRVVGEDLGTVPDYVRPNLQSLGIAGFKIPQWECPHNQVIPGDRYERLSVATYATHDHKPLRALWEEAFEEQTATSDQAKGELIKIAKFSGIDREIGPAEYEREFYPRIFEALFACNSWIAVVMLTDLLARKYRFNVPGTAADSNWTRRMQRSVAQLQSSPKERRRMRIMRELLEKTGRA
ncbi:MAG TPA: 4-alpha-glucanotransferase [Chthoniobacterales bacterium]|nr:4-alpha-glucanotransferase [Chthoniobacterales bacterium]